MATRATQSGAYVGAVGDASVRATQAAMYVGVKSTAVGARATQSGVYVGTVPIPALRNTQTGLYVGIRVGLLNPDGTVRELGVPCDTAECQCWRIERLDGVVLRFTSHDVAVTLNGETYFPCDSLVSSALQLSAEYGATENMDLSGIIADGAITMGDLWAGRYDGALVEVWRASWNGTTEPLLLAAGLAGSAEFGDAQFKIEITTAGQRLQQRPILQPVMPSCRFKLGDARCSVDLEALRVSGGVTGIPAPNVFTGARRRVFSDSSRAEADGYFQLGRITWTSGANTGQSSDIKSFIADQFVLEQAMQYEIEVGDDYTVVPGCNRIFETCDTKFSNAVNFGGFPHLRGTDDLGKTPGVKEG